ncbi:MAG: hypothetical protein QOJ23_4114, partial [Actinomycetota bacterium]|nr:hypothetical protein [Actinomycetota bacterium]
MAMFQIPEARDSPQVSRFPGNWGRPRRGTSGVVTVILAIVGAGVIAGLLAWGVTLRWPDHDPVAPRLEADSPVLQHETGHRPRRRALWRAGLDAEVATGLAVTGGAVALLVLVALAGVLLLMVRTHTGVARYDLAFARWGAAHASSGSTHVLRLLSNLGGTAGVVTVAVVVAAVEYRRLPNRAVPALLAVTVLGQFALVNLIKVIVERARPNLDQLTGFSSSSFPSGHAAAAAATFA